MDLADHFAVQYAHEVHRRGLVEAAFVVQRNRASGIDGIHHRVGRQFEDLEGVARVGAVKIEISRARYGHLDQLPVAAVPAIPDDPLRDLPIADEARRPLRVVAGDDESYHESLPFAYGRPYRQRRTVLAGMPVSGYGLGSQGTEERDYLRRLSTKQALANTSPAVTKSSNSRIIAGQRLSAGLDTAHEDHRYSLNEQAIAW